MRMIDADAFDRMLEDAELEARKNRKYVFESALNTIRGNLSNFPTVQPEPCEDEVSRKAVEEMLKNGMPERGMWEIEGDVVKQTVCDTLVDALLDLENLPSVTPKIITCQKCRHNNNCEIQYSAQTNETFWCAYGEPKMQEEG